jgi:hypothetical protein
MSLTIVDKPPPLRQILTYDLEWIPGEELYETDPDRPGWYAARKGRTDPLQHRLTGVYDGNQYRRYRSVDDFLNGELTRENRGKWFYAHAGGLADMGFVLDRIIDKIGDNDSYSVKASFSGSSAIIVKVTRGHNSWFFIDSYWLFRDKLANIAKFMGMSKGAEEKRKTKADARKFFAEAPEAELAQYNAMDCEILWKAISQFETALLELGGQLQMTIAACAMMLFRRKYLQRSIETSQSVNARAIEAYFSSRVEPFARECGKAYKWDLNSSFPYAMTFPLPGDCTGFTDHMPSLGHGHLFIADVDVRVPESYLPPLPRRAQGRVFFPTGRWSGWYTSVDIELLIREGGSIERVREVVTFESRDDLALYAMDLYARRKTATDSFEKIVYKYLLNSLYGKFGESEYKSQVLVNPEVIDRVGDPENGIEPMSEMMPGVWRQETKVPVAHAHVPIAAFTVARARETLYDGLSKCQEIYYTDTDSNVTTEGFESSNDLGQWKLEDTLVRGYFAAPKVYRYTTLDEGGKEVEHHHAKGFSDMDGAKFDLLVSGQKIPYQRMARLRELYGGKTSAPVEVLVEKALKGLALPKRCMYPDGHTRPWGVTELEALES